MLPSSAVLILGCTLDRGFEPRRLEDGAARWVYARPPHTASNALDQRDTWPSACIQGMRQSPINIRSSLASPNPELDGAIAVHIAKHVPLLVNTGHYFELDKTSPEHSVRNSGESIPHRTPTSKGSSQILGDWYNFYQVHWHTPSENTVDGRRFAMEAHYVHQLDDPSLVGTNARLAVLAVLYELQDACNTDLDEFWDQLPMTQGDAPFDRSIDIGAWLGGSMLKGGYYTWKGSLTTPPCTEGVTWVLLRNTSFVCQRQLARLKSSLALVQNGIDVNNRATQPTNGRRIQVTTTPRLSATGAAAAGEGLAPSELAPYVLLVMAATLLILGAWERLSRRKSEPTRGGHRLKSNSPTDADRLI